jgi:hypothetical protein
MKTAVECLIQQLKDYDSAGLKNQSNYVIEMPTYILTELEEQALEMEKEQREKDFISGYKKRAELSNLIYDEASELSAKELFKQQEQ